MKVKKSKLALAKATAHSRYWLKRADRAFSVAVRQRAGNACEICGTRDHVQAHHLLDRSYAQTRHELDNGVALCAKHHKYAITLSAHKGTLLFHRWLQLDRPATRQRVIRWALDAAELQRTGTKLPPPNYARAAMTLEATVKPSLQVEGGGR